MHILENTKTQKRALSNFLMHKLTRQWGTQEKISGVQGYGRPRRGSGGVAPLTPENFRKFAKKFLKKIAKRGVFSPILQRNFKTLRKIFARLTKNTIDWGNFEKTLKFFDENSIEKLNFYLFLRKFDAKYRAFRNNSFF